MLAHEEEALRVLKGRDSNGGVSGADAVGLETALHQRRVKRYLVAREALHQFEARTPRGLRVCEAAHSSRHRKVLVALGQREARALESRRDLLEGLVAGRLESEHRTVVTRSFLHEDPSATVIVAVAQGLVAGDLAGQQTDHVGQDVSERHWIRDLDADVSELQFVCHSYSILLVTAGSTSVANGSDTFDPTLKNVPGCEELWGLAHDAHARRSTGEDDVAREQRQDTRKRRD